MKQTLEKKAKRTRAKIKGTEKRPRLSVFRSNKYLYVQLIDDENKKTLIGISDVTLRDVTPRVARGKQLGILLAKQALGKKIKQVVFDRGGYVYHGVVENIADGAREGGLEL